MPSYFTPKEERQYQHVLDSTGSKSIAAATVNKYRRKHGRLKKSKRRSKH